LFPFPYTYIHSAFSFHLPPLLGFKMVLTPQAYSITASPLPKAFPGLHLTIVDPVVLSFPSPAPMFVVSLLQFWREHLPLLSVFFVVDLFHLTVPLLTLSFGGCSVPHGSCVLFSQFSRRLFFRCLLVWPVFQAFYRSIIHFA